MASPTVTLVTLLSLANGLSVPRQVANTQYIPIEYAYGIDSRATANITFGTAEDAQ